MDNVTPWKSQSDGTRKDFTYRAVGLVPILEFQVITTMIQNAMIHVL